jgi:transcriptional regulator with XRE-family HTH domain
MSSPSHPRLLRHPSNLSKKAKLFYSRYGRAIRALREQIGIAVGAIPELSARQVRRIERGECRVDSKIIVALAKAQKLTPNEYLGFVANMLTHIPPPFARFSGRYSAAVLWLKIDEKTAATLERQAKRRHLSIAKLSGRHLHEKIVEEEFSGLSFRDAFGVREANVVGHRLAVWEVVALFNQAKTVSKTAKNSAGRRHWCGARCSTPKHVPRRWPASARLRSLTAIFI